MADLALLINDLNSDFKGELKLSEDSKAIYVRKGNILALLKVLKEKYPYKMLLDISSVDYPEGFEVVYQLMSLQDADMICVKVQLPKGAPSIPSAMKLWKSADVMEREQYDLMGIVFENHENLTRVLCPDDFEGHPLRKDYKLDIPERF